jgi:hypothetical protein
LIGGSPLGASIPSFVVAFGLTLIVLRRRAAVAG